MSDRFRSLTHYLLETTGVTTSGFLESQDYPVLLCAKNLDWTEKVNSLFQTSIIESNGKGASVLPAKTKSQMARTFVIEVRKRAGLARPDMICVGRTANNDIIFSYETVSKFHAYFRKNRIQDSYEIVDASSTNGTKVNNQPLIAYQAQQLADNDRIQFSPMVQVMYLSACGFYEFLQQLIRSGIFNRGEELPTGKPSIKS